jgi:AmmeMemoRadiSam system protein B/AmmeMemoRadiSam system protein A
MVDLEDESMTTLRPATQAGRFYPADPDALRDALAGHLASAPPPAADETDQPPKMLVVPHAGYVYSGDVAGLAYAPLARWRERVSRVVLLGPVHRVPVSGLAAPTVSAFETPLGRVPLDRVALASLADLRQVAWADLPHGPEHSLEVQLPFLQSVLGEGFTLVPLAVGRASPSEVAEVLERLWGGDETLIVISSDLSHFLPYDQAQARDRATVQRILRFATDLEATEACGAAPLNGALLAARRRGLAADEPALGQALVTAARGAIAAALGLAHDAASDPDNHPALSRLGATFVTLHGSEGQLRGCVGRLQATRALAEDVRANALAAAFADTRFEPLRADEWPGLRVEVSLLDPPEPLDVRHEAEALAVLRPGIDGVFFEWRSARATLLPQVWAQCPEPAQFLTALKRKAGLPADFWAVDVRLSRYRVRCFSDPDSETTP